MDVPAPTTGPRNLAIEIAQWLRSLGFTAIEATHPTITTVAAHWTSTDRTVFDAHYEWWPALRKATFHLRLTYPGERFPMTLIKGQHVRRLKQVRDLMHNDSRFREHYQAAKAQAAASL